MKRHSTHVSTELVKVCSHSTKTRDSTWSAVVMTRGNEYFLCTEYSILYKQIITIKYSTNRFFSLAPSYLDLYPSLYVYTHYTPFIIVYIFTIGIIILIVKHCSLWFYILIYYIIILCADTDCLRRPAVYITILIIVSSREWGKRGTTIKLNDSIVF